MVCLKNGTALLKGLTQPKNKVKHDLQATSCPNLKDIPYFRGLGSLLYRKQTTRNSTEFFHEPLMETLPPPERATCDTHPEHPMPRRYEEVCEDVDERPEAPACGNHPLQPPFDRVAGLFQGVASQQAHLRRQNGPSVHSTRKKKTRTSGRQCTKSTCLIRSSVSEPIIIIIVHTSAPTSWYTRHTQKRANSTVLVGLAW